MGYVTGSSVSVKEMLQELESELENEGWSIKTSEEPSVGDYWLAAEMPDGSMVVNWVLDSGFVDDTYTEEDYPNPVLLCYGSTSYDDGEDWQNQPGAISIDRFGDNGPYSEKWEDDVESYWFFVTDEYSHLVAIVGEGSYKHCLAGKADNVSDGDVIYFQQVAWGRDSFDIDEPFNEKHRILWDAVDSTVDAQPNIVWSDQDKSDGQWYRMNTAANDDREYPSCFSQVKRNGDGMEDSLAEKEGPMLALIRSATVDFSDIAGLIPVPLFLEYLDDEDSFMESFFLGGWVKDHRTVKMDDIEPEEVITTGSDEWIVFPAQKKDNSQYWGWAYRRTI